jgi:membrane peptidoglycan carboxypeptidase
VTKTTEKFEEIQEKISDQKEILSHKATRTFIRHYGPWMLTGAVIGIILLLFLSLFLTIRDLPAPNDLATSVAQTTKILDRNGKLLYNVYVSENRTVIPLSEIPPYMREATISIEDKDFYHHGGVNLVGGILRAARDTVLGSIYKLLGRQQNVVVQGGSTITQQLIKKSLLTDERTIQRKIKEAILAFWTEGLFTKDQILTMYLNRIPYGGTAYGVEEASQVYFGKHARELTLSQASLLAALPAAPTYYSPFGTDPERAIKRQHQVLARMVEDGYINKDQAQNAANEPVIFATPSAEIKAPHFVAYVKEALVQKYGEKMVDQGGLKVTTSLDLTLQQAAQASLSAEVIKQKNLKVGNGAALITKPHTGEILAMIGSYDYEATNGGKVNVTLAKRSPGSSIKPFNYALGFLKGNSTPATPWIDAKFCFPPFNGKSYCPQNYDGKFHGVVQSRFALGNSLNIPAVKQISLNSVDDFLATASAVGLTTFKDNPDRYGYSLTLGGGEVIMTDMATAYGVFANRGEKVDLISILKVENSQGKILEDNTKRLETENDFPATIPWDGKKLWSPYKKFVLPEEVTFLISHILLDDGARSMTFGPNSILNIPGKPVSVKTGTAEDKRDNWTVGYTSGKDSRLIIVWVGNNDNSPMSPFLESGNTGAAPIWSALTKLALANIQPEFPKKPDSVVFLEVCSLSGLLPDHDCPKRGEYFIKEQAPKDKDNIWNQKKKIFVYKDTHKQPGPDEKPSPDQLTEEDHVVISDPLQKDFCVDCGQ